MHKLVSCAVMLAAAPFAVLACGSTTVANVTEYDQSCQAAADCVAVINGDICCGCPNAAINKTDLPQYQDDLAECAENCDNVCAPVVAECQDGKCVVVDETFCDPGEEVFCQCISGASGVKTCDEDGAAFSDCNCD